MAAQKKDTVEEPEVEETVEETAEPVPSVDGWTVQSGTIYPGA